MQTVQGLCGRGWKTVLYVFQQILVGLERSAKQFGFFVFVCFFQFSSLTYVSSHIWEMCFFFLLFFDKGSNDDPISFPFPAPFPKYLVLN